MNGKTVVIAGGSGGIGGECARLFVEKGFKVFNMSRTKCGIDGVTDITTDLADADSVHSAAACFLRLADGLDLLINSAGFSMAAPVENANPRDTGYLFEVNFHGPLRLIRALLPALKKRGGKIINISSTAALVPLPFDCFYSASKAALNMLTYGLRAELAGFGIQACALMPGGTRTPFTYNRKVYAAEKVNAVYRERLASAAEKIARIEQNGDSPKKVAAAVYRLSDMKKLPPLRAVGLGNKAVYMLAKILPVKLLLFLTRKALRGKT